ncbi:MAG: hypothetical protein RID91_11310 [Azospirillaceae bacterium]
MTETMTIALPPTRPALPAAGARAPIAGLGRLATLGLALGLILRLIGPWASTA